MAGKIIKRIHWGAEPLNVNRLPVHPADWVFIHHAVSAVEGSTIDLDNDGLPDSFERILKAIEQYHKKTRGWRAEAYNFFVGHRGHKAEGRGWNREGGATGGWADDRGISICAIGNYHNVHDVTPELVDAYAEVIAEGIVLGELVSFDKLKIVGHRDKPYATACPGDRLYKFIPEVRRRVQEILQGDSNVRPILEWRVYFNVAEIGDVHPIIEFVHRGLAKLGHYSGPVDDVMTQATLDAWKAFEIHEYPNATNANFTAGKKSWPRFVKRVVDDVLIVNKYKNVVPSALLTAVDAAHVEISKAKFIAHR